MTPLADVLVAVLGALAGAIFTYAFVYIHSRHEKYSRDEERIRKVVMIENGLPAPLLVIGNGIYHLVDISVDSRFKLNNASIFPFQIKNTGNTYIESLTIKFICDLKENKIGESLLIIQYYADYDIDDTILIRKLTDNRLEILISYLNVESTIYFEVFIEDGYHGKIGAIIATPGVEEDERSRGNASLLRPNHLKPKGIILWQRTLE